MTASIVQFPVRRSRAPTIARTESATIINIPVSRIEFDPSLVKLADDYRNLIDGMFRFNLDFFGLRR